MTKKQIKKLVDKGIIKECPVKSSMFSSTVIYKVEYDLHIAGITRHAMFKITSDLLLDFELKDFKNFFYDMFFKTIVLEDLSKIKKEELIDKVFNKKK